MNYWSICWPSNIILRIPFPVLSLIHAISAMLFSGGIITTTVIEWVVIQTYSNSNKLYNSNIKSNKSNNNNSNTASSVSFLEFWFMNAPKIGQMIVLPAITGSVISGIGQTFIKYGNIKSAPHHVKSMFHLFLIFGIWWGITDRTTQRKAQSVVTNIKSSLVDHNNENYDETLLLQENKDNKQVTNNSHLSSPPIHPVF